MQYETDCSCGKVVVVQAADAGGTLRCACGREVEVPALSRLRRLDPPPPPSAPPPVDYAFLRVPGVITTLGGMALSFVVGVMLAGATGEETAVRPLAGMVSAVAQIVGTVLVCVSKRFPIFLCILLPPFGCFGMVVATLIPERLPPVPPPPR